MAVPALELSQQQDLFISLSTAAGTVFLIIDGFQYELFKKFFVVLIGGGVGVGIC